MGHALIVSFFFPPRFDVGGKRAHRFARYLPDYGWSTTVLTAPLRPGEQVDPSFDLDGLSACTVRYDYLSDSALEALSAGGGDTDGTVAAPTKPWRRAGRRSMYKRVRAQLRLQPLVGPQMRYVPAIARRIARAATASECDVIFATGSPWESLVAASIGARIAGKPLVVDFRDPWSFGPVRSRKPMWLALSDDVIERAVLHAADAVTVTTETTREEYQRRAPASAVHCVRNGYDPALVPSPSRSEAVTLVHFGSCYGERNLSSYLRALARVVERRRLSAQQLRVLNLGRVSGADVALAAELGISDYFQYRTVLPYTEGLSLVAGADLALLPRFGDTPWFIPGKLYDYLLTRTPILAIESSAELDELVEHCGAGWSHGADDIDGLARRIERAIDARVSNVPLVRHDDAAVLALSARAATGKLAALFDGLSG